MTERWWNVISWRRIGCLVLAMTAGVGVQASFAEERVTAPATTRAAMEEIFAQLQILLPAAIQDELGSSERAPELSAAFERLQGRIDALPKHGNGLDPGARLFGRALSRDVRRAHEFFKRGRFENAAFVVESLVDDCTACHARGPAGDSQITQGFLQESALKALDPLERAAISVATRQFEDAMRRYESSFREPAIAPGTLLGPMVRYLTVTLRVARDPARAGKLIRQFSTHPNIAKSVREDAQYWNKVLDELAPRDLAGTTLFRAREATKAAESVGTYSGDPRALIQFLVASAQLHDLIELPQDSPADVAEIYELLGRAELGAAQSVWISRADLYWETAIRLAPMSEAAKRSYDLLEKETHAGFTGSGGLRLPAEEAARLAELAGLLGGAKMPLVDGALLFADHCAVCHGANANGHGFRRPLLDAIPADLTQIAARRGGEFPESEVFKLIARRDPLADHQSPEMPRWGEYWADDSKIDALVKYLGSIQEP